MKQFISKAVLGLMLVTMGADTATAQTIFRGLRSKKTSTNFKTPVVYSLSRADSSLNFDKGNFNHNDKTDANMRKSYRDSLLAQKNAASKINSKADSIANPVAYRNARRIDSIAAAMNQKSDQRNRDSFFVRSDTLANSVDAKLTAIQEELQNIKTVMRNQALIPRYRYMRYQLDSLGSLRTRVNNKPSLHPADRLQLRVYQLQQDSIRNEMQKLIWLSQYPAKDLDSNALFFDATGAYPGTYQQQEGALNYSTVPDIPGDYPRMNDTTFNSVVITDTTWYSGFDTSAAVMDSLASTSLSKNSSDRLLRTEQARTRKDSVDRASNSVTSDKAVRADNALRADSLQSRQNKAAADYNARINTLQHRLDSMERVANNRQSAEALPGSSTRSTDSARNVDGIGFNSSDTNSISSNNISQKTLDSFNLRLSQNSDSLASMQSGLKAVRDSAAYYRRTMYAMDLDPADTVVEKKKWYNRILPKGKKQKEEEADLAIAKSYTSQENYFAEQAKNMSRDIERLQRDNQSLKDDYDRLRRSQDDSRNNRRYDRYLREVPTVIQAGSNLAEQRELSALRREISEMRQQLTNNNGANRDTVVMQLPQNEVAAAPATPNRDSAQIISLQGDLASLRKELDSIRRLPPPKAAPTPKPAERVTPAAPAYDVSSFPVISVYFAMNASTLPATQTGKISPMVSVAQKNTEAKIILSGFTDPVGNVKINTALAKKRIGFVRNLLVSRFKIPGDQIIIEEPEITATRGVKKANPLDRRVDLRFE